MIRRVNQITIKNYNKIVSRNVFDYKDPFLLEKKLDDEENSIKDTASNFSNDYLLPNVVKSFRNEKFDKNIMKEMGKLGFLGPTITPTEKKNETKTQLLFIYFITMFQVIC
jgi:hypothetical protein